MLRPRKLLAPLLAAVLFLAFIGASPIHADTIQQTGDSDAGDDITDGENGEDEGEESRNFFCDNLAEEAHPVGKGLANTYGVDYEEIMAYFCDDGHGFGTIGLAFETAEVAGGSAGDYLGDGRGWGEIWQELNLIGRPDHAGPPNDGDGDGIPDFAGPPLDNDGDGRPDFAGPPDDNDGDGRPDFAGPPDDFDGDGRPDFAGRPDGAGPPDGVGGRPDDAGPPDGIGGGE